MNQLTRSLIAAAIVALPGVSAGWLKPQANFSFDMYCSQLGDQSTRACFTTDVDVSHPNAASHFSGFLSQDGKSFVIFDDGKGPAFLQTADYIINVSFNAGHCAAADVTTLSGAEVDNTNFCSYTSRFLHLPAK